MKKRLAIMGSTGSIGTQCLEIVEEQNDRLEITVLVANSNVELLINQARKFLPKHVVIADESKYNFLKESLKDLPIILHSGHKAVIDIVSLDEIDIVVAAIVGFAGLESTYNAIKNYKTVALANKETLVVAGDLITSLCIQNKVSLLPVDSEHSAIFQCLIGEENKQIEKIILTASGGPFRKYSLDELQKVSKEQALKHPNWSMGAKITIDSATLMNKGLEMIEAKWLFDLETDQVDVIVHPQSIVHSLVQFTDGSLKAQLGLPSMKLPIQYALSYPNRWENNHSRFSFSDFASLNFESPRWQDFKALTLAKEAMIQGGNIPCVLNAANEIAVDAFLNDKITFLQIPEIVEKTMQKITNISKPSFSQYLETDKEARKIALSFITI